MARRFWCFAVLPGLASACGDRCPELSRIDGGWAVESTVDHASASGNNTGSYPWDDIFIEGYALWDLTYVPANEEFRLDLDGQPYTVAVTPDAADCDAFAFAFDGIWLPDSGIKHTFSWTGDLKIAGVHWQGSFAFEDSWTDNVSGDSGTLSVDGGALVATACGEDC